MTRLILDSRLEGVAAAGHAVREFALAAGLDEMGAGDLELATVEAANNIIVHGFRGGAHHRYSVEIEVRGLEVQVTLRDPAQPIPPEVLAEKDDPWSLDAEAARGVAIMRACTDRLEYRREGGQNCLVLAKRLPGL